MAKQQVDLTYLDTHVVVWLYDGLGERFGKKAKRRIDTTGLRISPIVMLELAYLHEIGRLTQPQDKYIDDLIQRLDAKICEQSFESVASAAVSETWTRDPFDRIVVAHARAAGGKLLTADTRILDAVGFAVDCGD